MLAGFDQVGCLCGASVHERNDHRLSCVLAAIIIDTYSCHMQYRVGVSNAIFNQLWPFAGPHVPRCFCEC